MSKKCGGYVGIVCYVETNILYRDIDSIYRIFINTCSVFRLENTNKEEINYVQRNKIS